MCVILQLISLRNYFSKNKNRVINYHDLGVEKNIITEMQKIRNDILSDDDTANNPENRGK